MDNYEHLEWVLRDLLEADDVVPDEFWKSAYGSTHLSGERALMWAVFADGIASFRRNAHALSAERQVEFNDTELWMLSTDRDWPFSFINLCEMFGFSAPGVRRALLCWKNGGNGRVARRQRFRPVTLRAA